MLYQISKLKIKQNYDKLYCIINNMVMKNVEAI